MTGQFEWKCPKCDAPLYLFIATLCPTGVPITPDGFDLSVADNLNTQDEMVRCEECGYVGDLEYLDEDEDRPLESYNLSDLGGYDCDEDLPGGPAHFYSCHFSGQDCEVGCECRGCPYHRQRSVEEV